MKKRMQTMATSIALLLVGLLVIYSSGCKEGNNTVPLSVNLIDSELDPIIGGAKQYIGSYTISGKVLASNSAKIANVPVSIFADGIQVAKPVKTTLQGEFIFENLASAMYTVAIGEDPVINTTVYIKRDGSQLPLPLEIAIDTP